MNPIHDPCRRRPLALAISLAFAAFGAHASGNYSGTVAITSNADGPPVDDNSCTLREAIMAIALHSDTYGCVSSSGWVFSVPSSFSSITDDIHASYYPAPAPTISLTGSSITLSNQLIQFDGQDSSGKDLVIDAGGNSRIFDVYFSTLNLYNMTLTGGSATVGGALYVHYGTAVLTNSTLSGNTALQYGGGIFAHHDELILTNSTISGNSALDGGGIYAATHSYFVDLEASTVSGNTANFAGGGVYIKGDPVTQNSVTIWNSTIAGNSAFSNTGGAYFSDCSVHLSDTTISQNSSLFYGGVYSNSSALTADNSILSGNTSHYDSLPYADLQAFAGSVDASYDLLGAFDVSQSSFSYQHNLYSQIPGLYGLADNGGPTKTMALKPGSPAFNAGGNVLIPGFISYDQRGTGYPRIVTGRVDIGAFESRDFIFINGFESGP